MEVLTTPDGGKLTIYTKAQRDNFVNMLGKPDDWFVESPQFVMEQLGWSEPRYARNDPFNGGPEVWLNEYGDSGANEPRYPEGFLETFGPRPQAKDFVAGPVTYQEAIIRWEQDLKHFKQAGVPEWVSPEQMEHAATTFDVWGMGRPRPYEGRYGWMVRFPESKLRTFEVPAWTALNWTHGVVAQYQVELASNGILPNRWHPYVPPFVRGE